MPDSSEQFQAIVAVVRRLGAELRLSTELVDARHRPTGNVYTSALAPVLPLPPVPFELLRDVGNGCGAGEHVAPIERVPHKQRHDTSSDGRQSSQVAVM